MLKSIILPWQTRKNARLFATLQYKMNQARPEGLTPYKKHLSVQIERTPLLTGDEKNKVLKLLDGLPDGDSLCHGDFHPDNIVLTANGPVIIDWMTACVGCAAADVSRSCLVLDYSQLPDNIPKPIHIVINHVRKRFRNIYITEYQRLSGCTTEEINEWLVPLAAARLDECRPPREQELLLSIVREYFSHDAKAEK